MNRKKRKISFFNILESFLFITGFFFASHYLTQKAGTDLYLSANAAMTGGSSPVSFNIDYPSLALIRIPTHPIKEDLSSSETYVPENKESETAEPIPDAPVLQNTSADKPLVTNDSGYEINTDELLSEPVYLREGDIKVLIVHTHTSEAYIEQFSESDSYRSEDDSKNVIAVGDVIENVLNENGIGVIHDKTYHDYPSYSGAYRRSMDTVNANLEKYPSITFVLDIHRDAISDGAGGYLKTLAEIDGQKCAQGLIVIGTDADGLTHPMWCENLKYGLRLQKIMCEKYPGFARPLHLRSERFNGHLREGAMILEIGSNANTLEEAKTAALYMGDCLTALINSLEIR